MTLGTSSRYPYLSHGHRHRYEENPLMEHREPFCAQRCLNQTLPKRLRVLNIGECS